MGNGEEFHGNSVCIGNIDNALDKKDKVAVGSFEGKLRLYSPQPKGFKSEDVLLDRDLGSPILQLKCAKGMISAKKDAEAGGENMNSLAILHTRKFVIGTVKLDTYGFKPIYTHEFSRNLFNFCNFGSQNPIACV